MSKSVTNKLAAVVVAAATCGSVALGAVPAEAVTPHQLTARLAATSKIGALTGLKAVATKPGANYRVGATWNAAQNATSYSVTMTNSAGVAVAKSKVTTLSWSADTTEPVGSKLTVKVVPMANNRRGTAGSTTVVLPDVTAPVGQYSVTTDRFLATVTEGSLSDDVTARADIVRFIDWGTGQGWQSFGTGTTATFTYAFGDWNPKVQLVDAAGNTSVVSLPTVSIHDTTAPVGSYTLALNGHQATVTEQSLSDDFSATGKITREIDWDKGQGFESWDGAPITSPLYEDMHAYHPKVRVTDEAGNSAVIALSPVVIGDLTAPTGSFTAGPQKAWTTVTPVVLTQTDLGDNVSAAADVKRFVTWGDGSAETAWTTGTTLPHVYTTAGSYTPKVRLVDEAGNEQTVSADAVTVATDTVAPKVTVTLPRKKSSVAAWKTLHGKASDVAGTGVKQVAVKVVEKRRTTWYAYRASSKTWVRAGTTKAAAMKKTVAVVSKPGSTGAWSASVAGLRKGTLALSATAKDLMGNTSAPVSVTQKLTRR